MKPETEVYVFPQVEDVLVGEEGMQLRDYFAAKAMAAIIIAFHSPDRPLNSDSFANDAYRAADAMMSRRRR